MSQSTSNTLTANEWWSQFDKAWKDICSTYISNSTSLPKHKLTSDQAEKLEERLKILHVRIQEKFDKKIADKFSEKKDNDQPTPQELLEKRIIEKENQLKELVDQVTKLRNEAPSLLNKINKNKLKSQRQALMAKDYSIDHLLSPVEPIGDVEAIINDQIATNQIIEGFFLISYFLLEKYQN